MLALCYGSTFAESSYWYVHPDVNGFFAQVFRIAQNHMEGFAGHIPSADQVKQVLRADEGGNHFVDERALKALGCTKEGLRELYKKTAGATAGSASDMDCDPTPIIVGDPTEELELPPGESESFLGAKSETGATLAPRDDELLTEEDDKDDDARTVLAEDDDDARTEPYPGDDDQDLSGFSEEPSDLDNAMFCLGSQPLENGAEGKMDLFEEQPARVLDEERRDTLSELHRTVALLGTSITSVIPAEQHKEVGDLTLQLQNVIQRQIDYIDAQLFVDNVVA